ncbi:MAG: cation transporter [Clostridia bacterium]|nr:cation transporter [Clostridia bacterium]
MTDFLVKLFVKEHANLSDPTVRGRYAKLTGGVGIVCNILLCVAKILSGILFGSISLVADGVNNLSDMGNSVITLVGFRLAAKPADKDHPFGHARYEYITGLLVSFLIMMLGLSLLKTAVEDIFSPKEVLFHPAAIWVMGVAVVVKLWLYCFYKKIGKKLDSVAIFATAQDSLNDAFATAGILISFLLGTYFHLPLDGYVGAAVSLLVLYSGWGLISQTLDPLLGKPPKQELVKQIETEILNYHDSIIGIHDLLVHEYGAGQYFATVHVEFPASQNITVSHDIVDHIEMYFQEKFGIHLVIHMDPVETDNPDVMLLRQRISEIVGGISEELSIHDFRVVFLESHNNVLFDVVKPYEFPHSEKELTEMIQKKAGERNRLIIRFDHSY